MRVLLKIAIFLGLVLAPSIASARTVNVDIKSGQSYAYNFYIYSELNCARGPVPKAKIKTEPKQGTVKLTPEFMTPPKGKKCAGYKFKGHRFVYKSKRGYRGKDQVKVIWSFDRGGSTMRTAHHTYTFNFSIK